MTVYKLARISLRTRGSIGRMGEREMSGPASLKHEYSWKTVDSRAPYHVRAIKMAVDNASVLSSSFPIEPCLLLSIPYIYIYIYIYILSSALVKPSCGTWKCYVDSVTITPPSTSSLFSLFGNPFGYPVGVTLQRSWPFDLDLFHSTTMYTPHSVFTRAIEFLRE